MLSKMELEKIEKYTTMKSCQIYCGKLKKKVLVSWKNCKIITSSSPCELCGSHGCRKMEVKCVCGLTHYIVLESW